MTNIRYGVAMSLDGFIAGPQGDYDWITMDPELDFVALWEQFHTLLMGRRTYEVARLRLGPGPLRSKRVVVASRTLDAEESPGITVLTDLTTAALQQLRASADGDIWLMGGGDLFRTALALRQVDLVEVTIVPVLLGGGVPLAPHIDHRAQLKLLQHRIYPTSGLVTLTYAVQNASA